MGEITQFLRYVRFAAALYDLLGHHKYCGCIWLDEPAERVQRLAAANAQLPVDLRLPDAEVAPCMRYLERFGALDPIETPAWVETTDYQGGGMHQLSGSIDGLPWYFRAKHNEASLTVTESGVDPVLPDPQDALFEVRLPFPNRRTAGLIEYEEAIALLTRGLMAFRAEQQA